MSRDSWQLTTFSWQMLLPSRPEQVAGLLVTEVDWAERTLSFGTRFNENDHTKGRTSFRIPYPDEWEPILRYAIAGRAAGPLFRKRAIVEEMRHSAIEVESPAALEQVIERELAAKRATQLVVGNDAKAIVRQIIARAGGVTEDDLTREFRRWAEQAGCIGEIRYYDLRSAISSEWKKVGVDREIIRYLVGQEELSGGALDEYVALDIEDIRVQLRRHWDFAGRLLEAVLKRGRQLGAWR